MTRILERLSDQLSIRPGEPPSEASRPSSSDRDRASDSSHSSAGHISSGSDSHSSAELHQSVVSQLIGRASDMGSSQVFDQSSAHTGNDVRLWWRLCRCVSLL